MARLVRAIHDFVPTRHAARQMPASVRWRAATWRDHQRSGPQGRSSQPL